MGEQREVGEIETRPYGAADQRVIAERARSRALEDFRQLSMARDPVTSTPAERRRAELFEALAAGHDMLASAAGWKNTFPAMVNYLNTLK